MRNMIKLIRAIRRMWDTEPFSERGEEQVPERVVNQRVRNRIMEELSSLAGGQEELRQRRWEYLMSFLDWFPEAPKLNPATDIMLPAEREAVSGVLTLVLDFAEKGRGADADKLIELNLADTIAPVAERALALLNERGRYNEDVEEEEPSAGQQPD